MWDHHTCSRCQTCSRCSLKEPYPDLEKCSCLDTGFDISVQCIGLLLRLLLVYIWIPNRCKLYVKVEMFKNTAFPETVKNHHRCPLGHYDLTTEKLRIWFIEEKLHDGVISLGQRQIYRSALPNFETCLHLQPCCTGFLLIWTVYMYCHHWSVRIAPSSDFCIVAFKACDFLWL